MAQSVILEREVITQKKALVGSSPKRKEALQALRGEAVYTDDVEPPTKVYYVSFVRSPYARAKIRRIELSRALSLKGVAAAFTGKDFENIKLGYWMHHKGMKEPARHPLALDVVRYHGEPVVAIVAENQYIAEDAAELVEVEYEPLTPIIDPLDALKTSEKVFDELSDNVLFYDEFGSKEDVENAISACDIVIEETLTNGRTSPVSLETRTHIAWYDGSRLTIWASTQFAHVVRNYVAETLGFPENRIRVIAPRVGGGFGPKSSIFSDEIALYAIALKLKAAVKWVETRTEHLLITGHERDQIHFVKAGFTKDGRLVALYDRIVADVGAGATFWAEVQPVMVASVSIPGPYKFEKYAFEVLAVATNKAPWSPNIGFGRPVAAYVMERLMDIAAEKLGLDPAYIRRINLVRKEDFPYTNPAFVVYDSGDYRTTLDLLLDLMDYDELRKKQEELRKKGKLIGIGISVYSEYTAPPSRRLQGVLGWEVGGYERAIVRIEPTGKVSVLLGTQDTGQGHATIFSQIAAEQLGVPLEDVNVHEGDTDSNPYGFGTWASRSTATAGNAIILACRKLRKKVEKIAAHLLKCDTAEITIEDGVIKSPNGSIQLSELSKIAYRLPSMLPEGMEPGLEESASYDPPQDSTLVSYAWHGSVVEVDPETFVIKVLKYYTVDDAGVLVNPVEADAQVHGTTICQGMFQTFNELKYSKEGQLLTASFWEYAPPTAREVPEVFLQQHIESPSPTPGGFKGLGEGGAIGAPAALANAVADALKPLGVKLTKIPVSWNEIWQLVRSSVRS
jgi:carbon-monoxide dehydrogenase large subunit